MKQSFTSKEKLKSKTLIQHLFKTGKSVSSFPLKMVYTAIPFDENVPIKVGVSVSKRNFKKAVDRNYIKRLLRETYRIHKQHIINDIDHQYVCMILYLGKEKPDFHMLNSKMERLLHKFKERELSN